jgi:hypothetical protein
MVSFPAGTKWVACSGLLIALSALVACTNEGEGEGSNPCAAQGCGGAAQVESVELPFDFDETLADGEPFELVFRADSPMWISATASTGVVEEGFYPVLPPPMALLDPACGSYVEAPNHSNYAGGPIYLEEAGCWTFRVSPDEWYYYDFSGDVDAISDGFATQEPDSPEAPLAPFADSVTSGEFWDRDRDFGVVLEDGDADWLRAPMYDTRWPIIVRHDGAVPGHTARTRVTAVDPYGDETLVTDDLFAQPYAFYWSTVVGDHLLRFENAEQTEGALSWFFGSISVYGEEFDPTSGVELEIEPNDAPETAQVLPWDGSAPNAYYQIAGSLDPAGGEDWFSFTVPEGGQWTLVGLYDPFIGDVLDAAVLYDTALQPIESEGNGWGYHWYVGLVPGDYLIQTAGVPSGYYVISIEVTEDEPYVE